MSGLGDKEIAVEMQVGFESVRTYWHRIRSKIGGKTRAELIAKLVEEGAALTLDVSITENERLVAEIAHRRLAEQQFEATAAAAPLGIFVAAVNGDCVYVNDQWREISGMTRECAMGSRWHNVVHPEDRPRLRSEWMICRHAGERLMTEVRLVRPDGSMALCRVVAATMRVEGVEIGSVGTVEDITAQRELSQRLAKANDFTEAILNTVSALVIVLDRAGRVVRFNRSCETATGYSEQDLIGKNFFDILVQEHERAAVKELFSNPNPVHFPSKKENTWIRRDGSSFLVAWSNTVMLDSAGKVEFIIKTGIDITEQRRLQNELRAKDEMFHSFMDHLPAAAFTKDNAGRVTFANARYHELFGFAGESLVGKRDEEFLASDATRKNKARDRALFKSDQPQQSIEAKLTPTGVRHFMSHRFLFDGVDGERLLGGIALDITALREAEEKLRLASDTSFDVIMILRPRRTSTHVIEDFVYEFANSRAEHHLGLAQEQIIGKGMMELSPSELANFVRDQLTEVLKTREPFEQDVVSQAAGRRGRWIHFQAHAVGDMVVLTIRDIHEHKLEHLAARESVERLNQAERLGKVGSYEFDPVSKLSVWSPSMHEMFGVKFSDGPLSAHEFETLVHPEDLNKYKSERDISRRTGAPLDSHFRVITKAGQILDVQNRGAYKSDGKGKFFESMGTMRDATQDRLVQSLLNDQVRLTHVAHVELEIKQQELERANVRLSSEATTDGLTGLRNHNAFHERLNFDVALSTRHSRSLTVAILDLDHFKTYNDTFGHPAGDVLLARIGAILRENTRQGDYLSRCGGEEFGLILASTDLMGGLALCEKIRIAIANEPWPLGSVTASFGCAQMPQINGDAATLFAEADQALYSAKTSGRNQVCCVGKAVIAIADQIKLSSPPESSATSLNEGIERQLKLKEPRKQR